jgi:hypothetical protein
MFAECGDSRFSDAADSAGRICGDDAQGNAVRRALGMRHEERSVEIGVLADE